MPDDYSNPNYFNLTRAKIPWDVFYGESPLCGDMPCHTRSDYPGDRYTKKMILPTQEMPLVGYKKGQKIYLRATFALPDGWRERDEPLVFHSRYIFAKRYQFYVNNVLIDEGESDSINLNIPGHLLRQAPSLTLSFAIDPGTLVYQGIANTYELLIGPKSSLKDLSFFNREVKTTYFLWFLLPKLTFCLIFGLVFLFVSRTKALFLFVMYAFFSSLEAFLLSEYAVKMLDIGNHGKLFWSSARVIGVLFLFAFIYERQPKPSFRFSPGYVWGLAIAPLLALWTTGTEMEAASIKVLNVIQAVLYPLIFAYGWWSLKSRARKRRERFLRWFFAFSTFVGMVWLARTTTEVLNIKMSLGFAWTWINDLVMFVVLTALAVMDVGDDLATKALVERELSEVNHRLELGRAVQRMLLPKEMAGQIGEDWQYRFYYEPAYALSGDWLSQWRDERATCFFIGDVVGKGPQAALAVSIVSSIIAECGHQRVSVEDCIRRINSQLLHLFEQHITTTFSAILIAQDGTVELYNAGAIGWFRADSDAFKHLHQRSMPLGMTPEPSFAKTVLSKTPGMRLFTFTDGVLEGARAMRQLLSTLKANPGSFVDFDALHRLLIETGLDHVLHDDKTVLMVGQLAQSAPNHPGHDHDRDGSAAGL